MLFADAVSIAPIPGFSGGSVGRAWLWRTLGAATCGAMCYIPPPTRPTVRFAGMIRGDQGIKCVELDWAGARLYSGDDADVMTIRYAPVDHAEGFWAITRLHRCHRFETTGGAGFTADERRQARLVFFDEVVRPFSGLPAETLRRLPKEDVMEDPIVWTGYLHDLGSLGLGAWFIVSLAWVPRIPVWWRERRARRRERRGLCVACGYSLAGLAEGRCPECGAARSAAPYP